jgi:D-beta-D-heptose 7-phosphate kinase/D-beta-D-heptose 1-phosphate adenosyltransferase
VPLVVIVNGDGFLTRKKGFAFMPEAERSEIIAGIAGVDAVVIWDDGTQFVTGALDILRPIVFAKGGDRDSASNVPEFELCEKIGCKVIFGVGGGKIQSSSELVRAVRS